MIFKNALILSLFFINSATFAEEQWFCRFKGDESQVIFTDKGFGYKTGENDDWLSSENADYIRIVNTDALSHHWLMAFFINKNTGEAAEVTHLGSAGYTSTKDGLCVKNSSDS